MRSTKATKLIEQFDKKSDLTSATAGGAFSHAVGISTKRLPDHLRGADEKTIPQKYKNQWFVKEISSARTARREVIAQEFFRLLIPGHPKTRLVVDEKSTRYFVASKGVPGYQPTQRIPNSTWKSNFANGRYRGLGDVLLISLLMNEIDLKYGNMGIDETGRLIKIDGDWSFARMDSGFSKKNYEITPKGIGMLPYLDTYYAYNWFDLVEANTRKPSSKIFTPELSTNAAFLNEVHGAALRALLLPPEFIQQFVKSYFTDDSIAKSYIDEFTARQGQLQKAMLAVPAFQTYLKSAAAKKQMEDHLTYLKEFKTTGKNRVFNSVADCEKMIAKQFEFLKNPVVITPAVVVATVPAPAPAPTAVESKPVVFGGVTWHGLDLHDLLTEPATGVAAPDKNLFLDQTFMTAVTQNIQNLSHVVAQQAKQTIATLPTVPGTMFNPADPTAAAPAPAPVDQKNISKTSPAG